MNKINSLHSGVHAAMALSQLTLRLGICFLFSTSVFAQNCKDDSIGITTQAQVDNFQTEQGPCDFVVGSLQIHNASFANLAGLSGLTGIGGDLRIEQISGLTSLSDLSALTSVGSLLLSDSNSLTSLNGLSNITGAINNFTISRLRSLTDLTGLPSSLDSVGANFGVLRITGNDLLQSLNGMPAIASLGDLNIEDNAALADIGALAGSHFDTSFAIPLEAPQLWIMDNPLLASLVGIPPPTALALLEIARNPIITGLGPLDSLQEVWGDFIIFNNSNLSDCSALVTVLDDVDDGFPGPNDQNPECPLDLPSHIGCEIDFGLQGNATGCNSFAEIMGSGDNEVVFKNGFEVN